MYPSALCVAFVWLVAGCVTEAAEEKLPLLQLTVLYRTKTPPLSLNRLWNSLEHCEMSFHVWNIRSHQTCNRIVGVIFNLIKMSANGILSVWRL